MFCALYLLLLATVAVAAPLATITYPSFGNPAAAAYRVTTNQLPLFSGIAVQDSWAGRILSSSSGGLFFWYFPSSKAGGSKTLTIWLNGGPGCSSVEGATQENGAFTIAPGSYKAVVNVNGWTTESDMLYIDQPAGVGFSTGSNAKLTGEVALANAFYIFLKSFYGVFPELASKTLYLSGESYAGVYIPYIATRLLAATKAERAALPITLGGLLINDGVYSSYVVRTRAPIARFAAANAAALKFNSTFVNRLMAMSTACGYEALLNKVTYPQLGGHIKAPVGLGGSQNCQVDSLFWQAATEANRCFTPYRFTDVCPTPIDLIEAGFYFQRGDVQAALHVGNRTQYLDWRMCGQNPFVKGIDQAVFTEQLMPALLARIPVLLWHGQSDALLFTAGDLLTIQNMTWNNAQGFASAPTANLTLNGVKAGTYHYERSLTFVAVDNAGHMLPAHQPAVALAVFKSFISSGSLGTGALLSSSGEFLP